MSHEDGWIGVDLDGTLAHYDGWKGADHIGEPVVDMVNRVRVWLAEGREVRIFTARMYPFAARFRPGDVPTVGSDELDGSRHLEAMRAIAAIRAWCQRHFGTVLTITNVKDYAMLELWDDRAVQVEANTGRVVGYSTRGHSC